MKPEELLARAAQVSELALRPNARHVDATGEFPESSVAAVRDHGLVPLTVPRDYGGHDATLLTTCRVIEELGRGCTSTALVLVMHWISLLYLGRWCLDPGDEDERARLEALRRLVFGNVVRDGVLVASCYGEPGSGADIFLPFTRAEPMAAGWRLSGRKLGTLAHKAGYLALHAVVGSGPDKGTVVQFIVPSNMPGIAIEPTRGLTGVRGAAPCRVEFRDCLVADSSRFGPIGCFGPTNAAFPYATLLLSAPYIGLASSAVAAAAEHLRQRTVQGAAAPLASYPDLQHAMAQLVTEVEAARSLLYRAASEAVPHPGAEVRILNEAAKIKAAETVTRVSVAALQLCGARALANSMPLERFVRDSLAAALHPPTSEQAMRLVGQFALGFDPLAEDIETTTAARQRGRAQSTDWWPGQ